MLEMNSDDSHRLLLIAMLALDCFAVALYHGKPLSGRALKQCTCRERCPLPSCRHPYVMQSVSDPVRRETNPNPKWEVPTELIEWQPSYAQRGAVGLGGGGWSEDWQFTASTKCVHLLRRLYEIGAAENPALPHVSPQFPSFCPPPRHRCAVAWQGCIAHLSRAANLFPPFEFVTNACCW